MFLLSVNLRTKLLVGPVYENIDLVSIHLLTPENMETYYTRWETKWHAEGGKDINNPKIPPTYVAEIGELLWPHQKICGPNGSKVPNPP